MSILSFTNGNILTPHGMIGGAAIEVATGRIASVRPPLHDPGSSIDLANGYLLPGFIDVQVNGGGGVLFNDAPSVETIRKMAEAHGRFGTTALLPTLISDDLVVVEQALVAVDAAIEAGVPGVVGVHIEGPFLNPLRRGIHQESKLRRLDATAIALLCRPRRGRTLLTLAPELCTLQDVTTLADAGVIVSIGHSDADYDQATAAIDAGATGVTHLFNAMSPLKHRHPGVVGAAFDRHAVWCGLIADGFHIHPAVLRTALKILSPDKAMLVTDAMSSVGTQAETFMLQGKEISVAKSRLLDEFGTLAGCHLDMAQAVRNIVDFCGTDVGQASSMASTNPAAFLGLQADRGTIAVGKTADFVWLDASLNPLATWIGGRLFYAVAGSSTCQS